MKWRVRYHHTSHAHPEHRTGSCVHSDNLVSQAFLFTSLLSDSWSQRPTGTSASSTIHGWLTCHPSKCGPNVTLISLDAVDSTRYQCSSSMFQQAHKNHNAEPSFAFRHEMFASPRKTRPVLKDIHNALSLQIEESRRYVVLQTDPSSLSPVYPLFDRAQVYPQYVSIGATLRSPTASVSLCSSPQEDYSAWHARVPPQIQSSKRSSSLIVSRSLDSLLSVVSHAHAEVANTSWSTTASHLGSSQDFHDHADRATVPTRSFTPPISPPTISPSPAYPGYSSKRSGRTFALVPAEVDGRHVFSHVIVNQDDIGRGDTTSPETGTRVGLPKDMKDTLRQLDVLACWVKEASSSRKCMAAVSEPADAARPSGQSEDVDVFRTEDLTSRRLLNKGKNRLLSAGPSDSELGFCEDVIGHLKGAVARNTTNPSGDTHFPSEGFIYEPNRNTPEFLVGSSRSPIAYPVHGYSSHPSRYSSCRAPTGPTQDISYHRRFLHPRSAPCPPASAPLVTPPSGKTTFMAFFQRSRCNTTAVTRPSIPLNRGPIEGTIRREKRIRLPWLRI